MPAGRPRSDDPRLHVERVRTTTSEHQLLSAAAAAEGLALGPWLRKVALRTARRSATRQRRGASDLG